MLLSSWTKADDIRDFEIEGMSIGDSLLNFMNESEISNSKRNYFDSQEIIMLLAITKI